VKVFLVWRDLVLLKIRICLSRIKKVTFTLDDLSTCCAICYCGCEKAAWPGWWNLVGCYVNIQANRKCQNASFDGLNHCPRRRLQIL